jgi:hypothetical protein
MIVEDDLELITELRQFEEATRQLLEASRQCREAVSEGRIGWGREEIQRLRDTLISGKQ